MLSTTPEINPSVCLLADHLDMALAASEDLLAEQLAPPADSADAATAAHELADFVARLSRHEAAIVAHMLQARRLAGGLKRLPSPVRSVIGLMLANTSSLLALVATFGGDAAAAFKSGGDPIAFLRQRGLIAPDAGERPQYTSVSVTESYRIAGVVELGALMDLTATSLDVLDMTFGLYEGDGRDTTAEPDEVTSDAKAAGPETTKAAAESAAVGSGETGVAKKPMSAKPDADPVVISAAGASHEAATEDRPREAEAQSPPVTASSLASALAELRGDASKA